MTGASTLVDAVALLLFENLREGMETGRIANMGAVQTEVETAIAELNRTRLLEGSPANDVVANSILEIRTLREKFAKNDAQLVEFQSRVAALEEEITQIAACTEACNSRVEQQQKENQKVIAALEGAKASTSNAPSPCLVPALSNTNSVTHPSKVAVVAFPGGPRTVTIHPPGSPDYRSVIRDEKGDIIITFKSIRPLRREGAFRGPLEEIDWGNITHVYGQGSEPAGPRVAPPIPNWPDQSQPSPCLPPSRGPSDIIARQRQLSMSTQTDAFGRILAPDYLIRAKSPSLPAGMSSSEPSQDSQFCSSAKPDIIATSASTPPSPSLGRGKKRARPGNEDESVPSTERGASLLIKPQDVRDPRTPTPAPAKREESHGVQGPAKCKKRRLSATFSRTLATESGAGSQSQDVLDVTRKI